MRARTAAATYACRGDVRVVDRAPSDGVAQVARCVVLSIARAADCVADTAINDNNNDNNDVSVAHKHQQVAVRQLARWLRTCASGPPHARWSRTLRVLLAAFPTLPTTPTHTRNDTHTVDRDLNNDELVGSRLRAFARAARRIPVLDKDATHLPTNSPTPPHDLAHLLTRCASQAAHDTHREIHPVAQLSPRELAAISACSIIALVVLFATLSDCTPLSRDNRVLGSVIAALARALKWSSLEDSLALLGFVSPVTLPLDHERLHLLIPLNPSLDDLLTAFSSTEEPPASLAPLLKGINVNAIHQEVLLLVKDLGFDATLARTLSDLVTSRDVNASEIVRTIAKNKIFAVEFEQYPIQLAYALRSCVARAASLARPIPLAKAHGRSSMDPTTLRLAIDDDDGVSLALWKDLADDELIALYSLIERSDIILQALNDSKLITDFRWRTMTPEFKRTCNPTALMNITEPKNGTELADASYTALKFNLDYRILEARRLLQSSGSYHYFSPVISTEGAFPNEQQVALTFLSKKIYALPAGRAALTFGSSAHITTDGVQAEPIVVCARLPPMNVDVYLDPNRLVADYSHWPEFHNGVASGLRIPAEAADINSSWIVYNRPMDANNADFVDSRHAGFLLALGLNGQLRKLNIVDLVDYMNHQHGLSALALILGLSAANVGECEQRLSRLCYVHMDADIPKNFDGPSGELMQAVSVLSIGLLYLGSKRRAQIKRLFSILERSSIDERTTQSETTLLSAAFGIAFILLNKTNADGTIIDTPEDTWMQLRDLCITERLLIYSFNSTNESLICAGFVALGLIYQRTKNEEISKQLKLPEVANALVSIRSNALMMRVIAYCLVQWDDILPSLNWAMSFLPYVMRKVSFPKPFTDLIKQSNVPLEDANKQSSFAKKSKENPFAKPELDAATIAEFIPLFIDIVTGAALSLGIRYAGTHNNVALGVCISIYDALLAELKSNMASKKKSATLRLNHSLLRIRSATVLQAMSLIMVGSGDLSVMQRIWERSLRTSLVFAPSATYGEHMCVHQSLGFLFLGGGLYTLSSRRPQDVAALLLSLYPLYPQMSTSNSPHVQAYRHLWAMAARQNTILTLDADTGQLATTKLTGIAVSKRINDSAAYMDGDIKNSVSEDVSFVECDAPLLIPTDVDYLQVQLGKPPPQFNTHKRQRTDEDAEVNGIRNSLSRLSRILAPLDRQMNQLYVGPNTNVHDKLSSTPFGVFGQYESPNASDVQLFESIAPTQVSGGISGHWSHVSAQATRTLFFVDSEIARSHRAISSEKYGVGNTIIQPVIGEEIEGNRNFVRSHISAFSASMVDVLRVGLSDMNNNGADFATTTYGEDSITQRPHAFSTNSVGSTYDFLLIIRALLSKLQRVLASMQWRPLSNSEKQDKMDFNEEDSNVMDDDHIDLHYEAIRILTTLRETADIASVVSSKMGLDGENVRTDVIPLGVFEQVTFLVEDMVLAVNDSTILDSWLAS